VYIPPKELYPFESVSRMSANILQSLDKDIEQYSAAVKLAATLDRLMSSRDFQEVVLNGYLQKEAIRLVHLKAAKSEQSPEAQQAIVSKLDSIGQLHQYFEGIRAQAELARMSLNAAEQTRIELLVQDT
jgi:hypothetical protein